MKALTDEEKGSMQADLILARTFLTEAIVALKDSDLLKTKSAVFYVALHANRVKSLLTERTFMNNGRACLQCVYAVLLRRHGKLGFGGSSAADRRNLQGAGSASGKEERTE